MLTCSSGFYTSNDLFVLLYEKMQLVKLLTKTFFSSAAKVLQYYEKRESLSSASAVALFGGSLSVISP